MAEGTDLDAAADFLARMVLSYIGSPGPLGSQRSRAGGPAGPGRAAGRHPMSAAALRAQPPRPGGLGGLRPLRPAHLHRLHDPGPGGLAVPRLRRRRGQEDAGDPARSPGPPTGPGSSARPTPRRWSSGWSPSTSCLRGQRLRQGQRDRPLRHVALSGARPHQYYRLFTLMFLHLNFLHIAFNMITLLIVGPAVEVMLGQEPLPGPLPDRRLGGNVLSYLIARATSSAPAPRAPSSASWAPTWSWPAPAACPWARCRPDRHQPGDRLHRQHRLAGPRRRPGGRGPAGPGLRLRRRPAPGGRSAARRWAPALTWPCWPSWSWRAGRPGAIGERWLTLRQKSPYCFSSGPGMREGRQPPLGNAPAGGARSSVTWAPTTARRPGCASSTPPWLPGPPGVGQDHGRRHRPGGRVLPGHPLPDLPRRQGRHPRRRGGDRSGPPLLLAGRRHGRGHRPRGRAGGRHGRGGPPAQRPPRLAYLLLHEPGRDPAPADLRRHGPDPVHRRRLRRPVLRPLALARPGLAGGRMGRAHRPGLPGRPGARHRPDRPRGHPRPGARLRLPGHPGPAGPGRPHRSPPPPPPTIHSTNATKGAVQ
jgi:hypothetical protein